MNENEKMLWDIASEIRKASFKIKLTKSDEQHAAIYYSLDTIAAAIELIVQMKGVESEI